NRPCRASSLVSEDDQQKFIEQVASRMGIDASIDIRPALLVHTSLATVKFVLDRWLTAESATGPALYVQMEEALRITLAGFD
ncbi:MAG TPA: TetR family transcriptional regulator, partial [Mycobacterium sp.]|nr:TetR family transcriptional regulator [Mycobacterium sp.]